MQCLSLKDIEVKDKIQPYMDLIDYTPGAYEKTMEHLRREVLKSLGIPQRFISKDKKIIITKTFMKYLKKDNK